MSFCDLKAVKYKSCAVLRGAVRQLEAGSAFGFHGDRRKALHHAQMRNAIKTIELSDCIQIEIQLRTNHGVFSQGRVLPF